jgi:fluoride ion exporter CrcB/FEX
MSTKSGLSGSLSLARGSFEEEASQATPRLTMAESSESDREPYPLTVTSVAIVRSDHENQGNDHNDKTLLRPSRELGAPLSSQSLSSVQSTDQVLEFNTRLDLSDSTAIMSSLNKSKIASSGDTVPTVNYRSTSKLSILTARRLSRRPSIHETHDEEPLRRVEFLYYLYSFAILGTSIRVFLGRLFGQDCANPGAVNDFLSPLAETICVTTTGSTEQTGGALFIDLPANIFGCFIMGLISSLRPEGGRRGSKLPWLHRDHPLQKHVGIHHAIKVGLCGSLTTFSSWNSQMVAMMDGTGMYLGPQVVPALFGYVVGMACALWAFVIGGRVHEWLYDYCNGISDTQGADLNYPIPSLDSSLPDDEEQPPTSWDSEDSTIRFHPSTSTKHGADESARQRMQSRKLSTSKKDKVQQPRSQKGTIIMHKVIPFLLALAMLVAYGVSFGVYDIQFYREMFVSSLLTPIGAHLRWKLAPLNGRGFGPNHKYEWVPLGTFLGNMIAVVISAVFYGLDIKYGHSLGVNHPYVLALVVGMKTGLAGSLSTVSSFVKESVNLATIHPTHAKAYLYSGGTTIIAMLLGLAVYSPWMRAI